MKEKNVSFNKRKKITTREKKQEYDPETENKNLTNRNRHRY